MKRKPLKSSKPRQTRQNHERRLYLERLQNTVFTRLMHLVPASTVLARGGSTFTTVYGRVGLKALVGPRETTEDVLATLRLLVDRGWVEEHNNYRQFSPK